MKQIIILAAITTLLSAGVAFADRDYSFNKEDSFDGAAVKSILVDMPYGEINLVKAPGDKINVRLKNSILARDQAEADEINRDFEYKAELAGSRLTISVDPPRHTRHHKGIITRIIEGDWDENYYPALKVSVPDGKVIEIHTSSADINGNDFSSDLEIKSASSDITFDNTIGRFSCEISSGDVELMGHKGPTSIKGISSSIRLGDIEGDIDARTSSGDINVDRITGSVTASTVSGDDRVNDIKGDLNVSSSSGDIEVTSVSGSVRAGAVSGDVRLTNLTAEEGDFDVESVSGDISMEVSSNFRGEMRVNSVSGDVDSRLKSRVVINEDDENYSHSDIRGTVGDRQGKGRLNVASTSGDINIDGF